MLFRSLLQLLLIMLLLLPLLPLLPLLLPLLLLLPPLLLQRHVSNRARVGGAVTTTGAEQRKSQPPPKDWRGQPTSRPPSTWSHGGRGIAGGGARTL